MIKRFIVVALLAMLTACSSFKMGSMVYCHSNADCSFEQKAK